MLHLANGDDAAVALRHAGLDTLVWADCLDQGPVVGLPATPAFRSQRARFLSSAGLADQLPQLERWDEALLSPGELVCWFETDLNCMLALAHHLAARPDASVVISEAAPVSRLKPEEINALLPHRRDDLTGLARRAWDALANPFNILQLDAGALPPLAAALRRLYEELPDTAGVSRTERQMLETNFDFAACKEREQVPFLTDIFFEHLARPLRALDETQRQALLDGTLDWLTLAPERWIAGGRIAGPQSRRRTTNAP